MSLTGQGMVDFAKSKVGTPYFYGSKFTKLTEAFMSQMHRSYPNVVTNNYMNKARNKGLLGRICVDCSGLIGGYRNKHLGSSQLYSTAKKRLETGSYQSWANGVVCWRSGHVGVFAKEGNEFVVYEAKGIDYGTVRSKFNPKNWSKGLTFADIDYSYTNKVPGTTKQTNPYAEPTKTIAKGSRGEGVKWVQFELREAGFNVPFSYKGKSYGAVVIDGAAGPITDAAIRAFQASCKITQDGLCGPMTRKCLIAN